MKVLMFAMHPAAGRVAYGNNKPLLFKRRGLGRIVGIKSRISKTPSFLFVWQKEKRSVFTDSSSSI
jgi:hypothetical protein